MEAPWDVCRLGGTLDAFDRYMRGFGYEAYLITRERTSVHLTEVKDMEVLVLRA